MPLIHCQPSYGTITVEEVFNPSSQERQRTEKSIYVQFSQSLNAFIKERDDETTIFFKYKKRKTSLRRVANDKCLHRRSYLKTDLAIPGRECVAVDAS